MKNLKQIVASLMLFTAALVLMTNCGKKSSADPVQVLPAPTGDSKIEFLNYTAGTVDANPGNLIAIVVQITKGSNKPKNLQVWSTDVINTRGAKEGGLISLRNVDEPQVKNVNYTVPAGFSGTKYLYFEVEESNGKIQRQVFSVKSASATKALTTTTVILGGQSNTTLGSRVSSSNGYVYKACDVQQNIDDIDITFAIPKDIQGAVLCSNPARFIAPVNLTVKSVDCPEGAVMTDGGKFTYFASTVKKNFDEATDASLKALTTVSTSSPQFIVIEADGYYAFQNSDGKKGIIYVKELVTTPASSASVKFDIRVQP
jgi:hypothetical protein